MIAAIEDGRTIGGGGGQVVMNDAGRRGVGGDDGGHGRGPRWPFLLVAHSLRHGSGVAGNGAWEVSGGGQTQERQRRCGGEWDLSR